MPFDESGNWIPNPPQGRFLSIPDSVTEAAYLGGAGSGKSEVLMMFPIVRKWHEVAGFKQLFTRRTFPELKREIVPRSFDIYPKFGGKFNKIDMCWTFKREDQYGSDMGYGGGGYIFFGHCENESDVHQYDSMEINLYTPDEITSYLETMYMYIGFTRVRTSNPRLPAIIRPAGMPGGVGHGWVKKRFVDPHPRGGKLIIGRGGNKRMFIFATLEDNKDHIDPTYAQKLDALPEAERQAKKFGNFDAYSGQVFKEFRDKHYEGEPEHAVHIVPHFDPPHWWPKVVAIDWGMKAMCSVGWGAISPENRLYVYRHQVFYGKKIALWGPEVRYFIERDEPKDVVICHSATQQRGDPHNILEQVQEELGLGIRLGERDRVGGKLLLHEYLRWEPKPVLEQVKTCDRSYAMMILRNSGQKAYNDYMNSFKPAEPEILPKMQLMDEPDILLIADSIKACVYAKNEGTGKAKEDVAEFDGDDAYDMIRMLCHAASDYTGVAAVERERLKRTDDLVSELARTGDMTAFYRNARRNEQSNIIKPVSRFHKASHARY